MRKLFLLLSIITLLSSCSNDIESTVPEKNEVKYKVRFDIQNESFDITTSKLKTISSYHSIFQVRVYNESGEIYSQTLLSQDQINAILIGDSESIGGAIPLSLELPRGKYKVAFINRPSIDNNLETELEEEKQNVSNFYTDKIMMRVLGFDPHSGITHPNYRSNDGFHAKVIDLSVPNDTILHKIKIEPLWSDVKLTLANTSNYSFPSNVNKIALDVLPAYANFTVHDLLAVDNFNGHYNKELYDNAIPIDQFKRFNSYTFSYTISKTLAENNNMKVLVSLLSSDGTTNTLVDQYEINLNRQVENGFRYVIKGELTDLLKSNSNLMNITIGEFNPDDVNVEF